MGGYYDNCNTCVFSAEEECDYVEPDPDGGGGGETPPNPCDQAAQQAGADATNLFNNTAVQDAMGNIFPLYPPPIGLPPANESHFYLTNLNGSIGTSALSYLGPYGGLPSTNPDNNDLGELHTHPNSGNPPSAADIYRLGQISQSGLYPNFNTSFVVTAYGTQYALVIVDPQKLSDFMNQNGNFVDANTNGFNEFSDLWIDYNVALSQTGNLEHAKAYALRDSGIILLKQDSVNPPLLPGGFKKIGVREETINNQIILEESDCE